MSSPVMEAHVESLDPETNNNAHRRKLALARAKAEKKCVEALTELVSVSHQYLTSLRESSNYETEGEHDSILEIIDSLSSRNKSSKITSINLAHLLAEVQDFGYTVASNEGKVSTISQNKSGEVASVPATSKSSVTYTPSFIPPAVQELQYFQTTAIDDPLLHEIVEAARIACQSIPVGTLTAMVLRHHPHSAATASDIVEPHHNPIAPNKEYQLIVDEYRMCILRQHYLLLNLQERHSQLMQHPGSEIALVRKSFTNFQAHHELLGKELDKEDVLAFFHNECTKLEYGYKPCIPGTSANKMNSSEVSSCGILSGVAQANLPWEGQEEEEDDDDEENAGQNNNNTNNKARTKPSLLDANKEKEDIYLAIIASVCNVLSNSFGKLPSQRANSKVTGAGSRRHRRVRFMSTPVTIALKYLANETKRIADRKLHQLDDDAISVTVPNASNNTSYSANASMNMIDNSGSNNSDLAFAAGKKRKRASTSAKKDTKAQENEATVPETGYYNSTINDNTVIISSDNTHNASTVDNTTVKMPGNKRQKKSSYSAATSNINVANVDLHVPTECFPAVTDTVAAPVAGNAKSKRAGKGPAASSTETPLIDPLLGMSAVALATAGGVNASTTNNSNVKNTRQKQNNLSLSNISGNKAQSSGSFWNFWSN